MTRRAYSQEDANLGTNSVPIARKREYKDIDLTLAVKPTSGDIYKKLDSAAVKQAVKNLIMTNQLEKPFKPRFGANIRNLLFELIDNNSDVLVRKRLFSAITRSEPRVRVLDIRVSYTDNYSNTLDTTITFKVLNSPEVFQITTNLARLR